MKPISPSDFDDVWLWEAWKAATKLVIHKGKMPSQVMK
jgi:hypothetical protein